MLLGCNKSTPEQTREQTKVSESPYEKIRRWRNEAEEAVREELTNVVVGFHRPIKIDVYDIGDSPANWEGRAEAEFVNIQGGIQRTNLRFKFHVSSGEISARAEGEFERLERWRKEAPQEVRETCTNELLRSTSTPRIAQILRVDISGEYSSYDPKTWTATAGVEYLNESGLTERTNLPFNFSASQDYVFAHVDFEKQWANGAYGASGEQARDFLDLERRQQAQESEATAEKAKAEAAKAKADLEKKTLVWHQQLAEKGDAFGLFRMGERYLKGDGVPKDEAKGRGLLERAAAKGESDAKAILDTLSK